MDKHEFGCGHKLGGCDPMPNEIAIYETRSINAACMQW